MGIETEKLIGQLNSALQGLIMTCYIYSLYTIILMAFHMIFNVCLNNVHTAENKFIWFGICILSIIMYLIRLRYLMNSGQGLGNKIKESRRTLQDLVIAIPHSKINHFELSKISILINRLETYQLFPPITPYSVLSLNNKTFYATIATMITYMVILIKIRGVANPLD